MTTGVNAHQRVAGPTPHPEPRWVTTAIVIAKEPIPGRVKTRLVPPLTYEQAATVACAALDDTLRAVDACRAERRILAFDGTAGPWLHDGWRAVAQPEGNLDVRLVAAFDAVVDGPAVLVGMDTPQLCVEQLDAFDAERYDACLGMSTDGGYWIIGFADPRIADRAICGIPMSLPTTGRSQLQRLAELGLRVQHLDILTDVDTIETAEQVAGQAPDTAFAAALRRTKSLAS